jgi:hypothetical protein
MVLFYGRTGRLTAENGGFRPGQWVNFLNVAMDWGVLGSSATFIIFGAGLVVAPTASINYFGEKRALTVGCYVMIGTYLSFAVVGPYCVYNGTCLAPDGQQVSGADIGSISPGH